jgi:putative ABC transport system permease protein
MKLLPWEYAVRNLSRNPVRMGLSLAGAALISLLVIAASSFVRGMEKTLSVKTSNRNVILLGAGSEDSLERSEINPATGSMVAADIAGLKTLLNVPFVSPEIQMAALLREEPGREQSYLTLLRGIQPAAFLVHQDVRIVDGHAPDSDEILVGKLAAVKMGLSAGRLGIGKTLYLDGHALRIAGHFEAPGTVMEAEIWMPLEDLKVAAKRDTLSCVIVTLGDAEFGDVELFSKRRLDLELVAIPESDYYGKLLTFYRPVRTIAWVTALLIASGGLFGGLNIMYASFSSRTREMGALQSIGYSRTALLISLIQESVLIAMGGALLAFLIALLILDGLAVRISMGAFGLSLDGYVILAGVVTALGLGVIGVLPPAWRCLRMPLAEALKST